MMIESLRAIIATLVVAVACSAATTSSEPPVLAESVVGKVWMHINGPWESPPPEIELRTRTASATLFRLSKDGEFSLMHCRVIEQPDKTLVISRGDGQVIFLGTWEETGGEISATYRLVYETVQPVGGRKYSGPEQKGSIVLAGQSLQFDRKLFENAKQLGMNEYEEFIDPVRKRLKE